ncbi:hypothetical protein ACGFLS_21885 [Streptomyces abikoensis]|uniref:hypothetical protein n=1 Tax=Streptomyces abikoensis TaxID=97398 RepID=UPI00371DDA38
MISTVAAADPSCAALEERLRAALGDAFRAETAADPHEPGGLSVSGLGGCTRRGAYALAAIGTPSSNGAVVEERRAAHLGTWIHSGLLPRLAQVLGGHTAVEHPVSVTSNGVTLAGRTDLATYALAPANTSSDSPSGGAPDNVVAEVGVVVMDVKTVTVSALSERRLEGPTRAHRLQVWGYAVGLEQAGHQVSHTVIIYMSRERGDLEVFVEEFGEAQRGAVHSRIARLLQWAACPDDAPRDTPAMAYDCPSCPFVSRCMGPDGVPTNEQPTVADPAVVTSIETAGLTYLRASAAEKAARNRKGLAKVELSRAPAPGRYGAVSVRWTKAGGIRVQLAEKPSGA